MSSNVVRSVRGLFLVLVIVAFLAPRVHAAAGEKGSWELGLFGGYVLFDDYEGTNPEDDYLYGLRAGYWISPVCSIEGSAQRVSTVTDVPSPLTNVDFNQQSVRLNGLYNFRPGSRFRPFLTAGAGAERWEFQTIDRGTDVGVNVGGGLRMFVTDSLGIRLDGRYVYTPVGSNVEEWQGNVETTFGLLLSLGGGKPVDTDGDGVQDKKDDCPDTPNGAIVDKRGCPTDADGDKVYDGIDKCPDTKAGCPVDASGCPLDSDGDGVIDCDDTCKDTAKGCKADAKGCAPDEDKDGVCDASDKCPGTKSGCRVDASGCPADEDKDGVCDGTDKCPGTKAGCRVDASGCPADEDKDGVCDGVDKCAGTPAGARVDETGCEVVVEKETPLVLEGVQFEVNSAKLTATSSATLDRVAESLGRSPNVRVEVAGHTDSSGSDAYNQTLSQKRAESVRSYLVSKGVDASRVTAKGYGESQPAADNKTADGRARNRRVELRRLD